MESTSAGYMANPTPYTLDMPYDLRLLIPPTILLLSTE